MEQDQLRSTRCPICHTQGNAAEVYAASFDLSSLTPEVFSARRLPDRLHYRVVRCATCGLLRSDPVIDARRLEQLYAQSDYRYAGEEKNLRATYGRYLSKLARYGAAKGALLEIGCGEGVFLEEARSQGYARVWGVEPSSQMAARAKQNSGAQIICDMMRPGLLGAGQFDVICMFQVFDHVEDPAQLLQECMRALVPGGLLLCLHHNIASLSARLLGRNSPIVDIEHTYFYSPKTMRRLLLNAGFQVRQAGPAYNTYSLGYLAWLMPAPARMKRWMVERFRPSAAGKCRVRVPLGNLYVIAQKPVVR